MVQVGFIGALVQAGMVTLVQLQAAALLLNFSTLKPTVGTMLGFCSCSGLKWFSRVDFPAIQDVTEVQEESYKCQYKWACFARARTREKKE